MGRQTSSGPDGRALPMSASAEMELCRGSYHHSKAFLSKTHALLPNTFFNRKCCYRSTQTMTPQAWEGGKLHKEQDSKTSPPHFANRNSRAEILSPTPTAMEMKSPGFGEVTRSQGGPSLNGIDTLIQKAWGPHFTLWWYSEKVASCLRQGSASSADKTPARASFLNFSALRTMRNKYNVGCLAAFPVFRCTLKRCRQVLQLKWGDYLYLCLHVDFCIHFYVYLYTPMIHTKSCFCAHTWEYLKMTHLYPNVWTLKLSYTNFFFLYLCPQWLCLASLGC